MISEKDNPRSRTSVVHAFRIGESSHWCGFYFHKVNWQKCQLTFCVYSTPGFCSAAASPDNNKLTAVHKISPQATFSGSNASHRPRSNAAALSDKARRGHFMNLHPVDADTISTRQHQKFPQCPTVTTGAQVSLMQVPVEFEHGTGPT